MRIDVDGRSAIPIYQQVRDQIRRHVAAGSLGPGAALPSVRELAARLIVNPNTVARAYRELEQEGLLETRRGDGTYISSAASALASAERLRLVRERLAVAAREIHAFGIPPETALELFRQILDAEGRV